MPRRENGHRHRRTQRPSRPRLLIVCGSLRTGKDYLVGLRDSALNRSVDIQIIQKPKSPLEIVTYATKHLAATAGDFDQAWCVFDVDEFEVESAKREAGRRGYEVAASDPCFELWLLLHHEDCRAFQDGYKAVERRLKKHVAKYDKTKLDFTNYADGVSDAILRAEKLGETGNPSTGMWRLATRIRNEEDE